MFTTTSPAEAYAAGYAARLQDMALTGNMPVPEGWDVRDPMLDYWEEGYAAADDDLESRTVSLTAPQARNLAARAGRAFLAG